MCGEEEEIILVHDVVIMTNVLMQRGGQWAG